MSDRIINRRNFLRLAGAVGVGVAVREIVRLGQGGALVNEGPTGGVVDEAQVGEEALARLRGEGKPKEPSKELVEVRQESGGDCSDEMLPPLHVSRELAAKMARRSQELGDVGVVTPAPVTGESAGGGGDCGSCMDVPLKQPGSSNSAGVGQVQRQVKQE